VFAHLDRESFAVDTVLTVDDQPLSIRILLSSFRIYILVDSSRASSSKKSSVFFDIRLDVSCSIRFVDVKVNGLILSVVRTGSRDGGENVERENTIGCWVIDRLELTVIRKLSISIALSDKRDCTILDDSPSRFRSSVIL